MNDKTKRFQTPRGRITPIHSRFQPGRSGNPAGRPANAGSTLKEWINSLAELTRGDIQAIFDDAAAPVAKRAAANLWLQASSTEKTTSGVPIAGDAIDRIFDRTIGKPSQAVDVTSGGMPFQLIDRKTWEGI